MLEFCIYLEQHCTSYLNAGALENLAHVVGCLEMIVCQQQSGQSAKVANVLHAFDEIFADVERIELSYGMDVK